MICIVIKEINDHICKYPVMLSRKMSKVNNVYHMTVICFEEQSAPESIQNKLLVKNDIS